jgi:hypothetical protein
MGREYQLQEKKEEYSILSSNNLTILPNVNNLNSHSNLYQHYMKHLMGIPNLNKKFRFGLEKNHYIFGVSLFAPHYSNYNYWVIGGYLGVI